MLNQAQYGRWADGSAQDWIQSKYQTEKYIALVSIRAGPDTYLCWPNIFYTLVQLYNVLVDFVTVMLERRVDNAGKQSTN